MKNYNVPGPDGFTVNFYKANWYLVGKKFTKAIGHFFTKSFIYYPMNSTTISLIPKVETQLKWKTSGLHHAKVSYKVISKVLTNIVKVFLPYLVDEYE